ncbi:streptolysin S family TOMM toxin [Clostridium tarantellae]|uniref:Streptolysin S family bacteriocin n=1 Tax=Clostridium tarantellae TaxID=39493 RepID=A0A6I1MPC8_9CLOT|nr:streptolysin S family TOMM toxin [Clostridium tarantellae]MPQ45376.1 streptolysin S family bacteriocin [Clostridium tarantellae]
MLKFNENVLSTTTAKQEVNVAPGACCCCTCCCCVGVNVGSGSATTNMSGTSGK